MRKVDLVAKNQKGAVGQLLARQKAIELSFRFSEAVPIESVNHVDDSIHACEVVAPKTASAPVTTQVVCLEFDAADVALPCWGDLSAGVKTALSPLTCEA